MLMQLLRGNPIAFFAVANKRKTSRKDFVWGVCLGMLLKLFFLMQNNDTFEGLKVWNCATNRGELLVEILQKRLLCIFFIVFILQPEPELITKKGASTYF